MNVYICCRPLKVVFFLLVMMLVANSFDLWQKDTFFSAAEEVQQSADIMESAYRSWEREKREGIASEDLNELSRELQTTLGTAKWQLEEFEKAVMQSYRDRADDVTMSRHRQFVDAIENQISRVETALRESLSVEGKKPLQWVNLNEEECNDLAAFLSGTPGAMNTECATFGASTNSSLQENNCIKKERCLCTKAACNMGIAYDTKNSKDDILSNKNAKYAIDIEAAECSGIRGDGNSEADKTSSARRAWSSTNVGAWKIVIADDDEKEDALMPGIEVTPKDKGSRPAFWRQRFGDCPDAKGRLLSYCQLRRIWWINQVGGFQTQLLTPLHLRMNSIRFKLALLLTILLMVPFVLYST